MRILVHINKSDLTALNKLARQKNVSRARLIQNAIADYLETHRPDQPDAFGLWGNRVVDGLVYQTAIRGEW